MSRFFNLLSFFSGGTRQDAASGKETGKAPTEQKLDLENIQPMIVPSSYLKIGWDLPHVPLTHQAFIVCWVMNYASSNSYVMRAEYQQLEACHPGWQRIAVENLRRAAHFHKYSQKDEQGNLLWLAFMNEEDAVSSSKVLLSPELSRLFPQGYLVGIPNRVVGFVVSKKCPATEMMRVQKMVKSMYGMHGSPMSKALFDSVNFLLPDHLTEPIDQVHSQMLVDFAKEG